MSTLDLAADVKLRIGVSDTVSCTKSKVTKCTHFGVVYLGYMHDWIGSEALKILVMVQVTGYIGLGYYSFASEACCCEIGVDLPKSH